MATVAITGTIQRADGVGVANVAVRLAPLGRSPATGEAIGGIGILVDQIEVLTGAGGVFSIAAVQGFQYTLEIPALNYAETFTAPAAASIQFHLLGLVPELRQVKDFVDAAGVATAIVQVQTPRVATVLERFTHAAVERAPAVTGPWVEVAQIQLLSDTDSYDLTDVTPSAYYRARYRSGADASAYSDPVLGDAFREALVLSIAEFRDVYLFGIDLTDGDGNPYPSAMYEWYIKAATAWLEHALDISLTPKNVIDERHDHFATDYGNWGYFQLGTYPIQRVDRVVFQYPSMLDFVEINDTWIVVEDEGAHGVIQIVPGQGNIADVLLIPGALMPMWSGASGRVPGVWKISYRTGFEPEDMPYDLRHLVGMMASLGILNVAGDLVGGSGLQGWSASVPGLTQNITTTNSSTNAGFGARVLEYGKEIKMLLPVVKAFYGKTIKMVVV